jgi:glycosyltransferase involved in cell wall biosynthesis
MHLKSTYAPPISTFYRHMKLIIQIPCYNEADTLPDTLAALPTVLPGIDTIETMVIDDGSTDHTVETAHALGVDHMISLPYHSGLAAAFRAGLDACLERGAEIIVNTDADNQYNADDIPKLIEPILAKRAQLVIGDRGVAKLEHFSPWKRMLQRLGSWFVSQTAGMRVPDATSGFRALSYEMAMRTLVLSQYSYTLETIIQAGAHKLPVEFVPVRTNPNTRPSRLMSSTSHYLRQSIPTILRAYAMYQPLRVFSLIGTFFVVLGLIPAVRFLILRYVLGQGSGNVQSLILSALLIIVGIQVYLFGILADIIAFNRKMLEEQNYRLKRIEYRAKKPPHQ